jgi:hypothetical protein
LFSTMLEGLKGYFGRDFLLGAFFPIAIFAVMNLGMYFAITIGIWPALAGWEKLSVSGQAAISVGAVVAVTVAAYLTFTYQYLITRLFEGYWPRVRPLKWLRRRLTDFHRRRLAYLDHELELAPTPAAINEINAEQLAYYPPPGHADALMPTLIGNILRVSEIHAYDHYKLDSTIIWPRLRPLLPAEVGAAIDDKKTARDFSLLITLFTATFALVWFPLLMIFAPRWELFLICAISWLLSLISYRNAVQGTLAYGEQIKATFDVHRSLLLKALGRELPKTIDAERLEWLRLSRFIYRNIPIPVPATPAAKVLPWDDVAVALKTWLERDRTGNDGGPTA